MNSLVFDTNVLIRFLERGRMSPPFAMASAPILRRPQRLRRPYVGRRRRALRHLQAAAGIAGEGGM